MSKTTLSILGSILLGGAVALPAFAKAAPAQHHILHMPRAFARHFGDRFAEPRSNTAGHIAKLNVQPPVRPDSGSYEIIDHANADPGYGTRVNGINESGVTSGQYVDANDGTFHAFLRNPGGSILTDIQVGHNDTFILLLNDKNETFGSYDDKDTGLENAWVRTKDGTVTPIQVPHGTGGSFGQFINNKGVLSGNYLDDNGVIHSFTRTRSGVITELDDAPNSGSGDGQGSQGIGINNRGDIAGGAFDSNNHMIGFIRSAADGSYMEFEAPGAGPGESQGTEAYEINERGRTNGQVVDANGVFHGFIRYPDGKFTIVDAPDAGTGPNQGTFAVEHCEGGWCMGEYIDSNDVSHGYYCTDSCKKRGEILEYDPPGAGDIGAYTVISSNKGHRIAGTFKDDSGIRHGFIRNPH
jgi:hypothetical protein